MKTVKAKIKGTNAILEGCVCDDSFFVSVDHDTFERYDLDEVELCEFNPNSLTLEEAAEIIAKDVLGRDYLAELDEDCAIDALNDAKNLVKAGAEWQKSQMFKDAVEGVARPDDCEIWVNLVGYGYKFNDGEKVRIVVLKTEE